MIRVLLVLDTCLMRSAFAALLARERDIEVVAAPWRAAAGKIRSLKPDVCVVDTDCPDSSELASVAGLPPDARGEGSAVVLLVAEGRPGVLRQAVKTRALGYVSKNATPDRLVRGIRRVAAGERYIDSSLGFGFLKAAEMPLTPRELSVLSLAAEGASVTEIARTLHLSNGTVRNYMAAINRKTGARNRVDAIRISRGEGWL